MKKKKLTYVLLPLVLVIWAMVFYKIFTYTSGGEDASSSIGKLPEMQEKVLHKDSFTIEADYKDPFLGHRVRGYKKKVVQTNKKPQNPKPRKKEKPKKKKTFNWPEVRYGGIIKNKENGKVVALIRINSQKMLMKEGQEIGGISLKKLHEDSVLLSYRDHQKYFKK